MFGMIASSYSKSIRVMNFFGKNEVIFEVVCISLV